MPDKRRDVTTMIPDQSGFSKQTVLVGGDEDSYYATANPELGRRRGRAMPEDGKPTPPLSEGLSFVEQMAPDSPFE